MPGNPASDLQGLVDQALLSGDVESAVVFLMPEGGRGLELGAAAGIEGPALAGLVAAIQHPAHPVARAIADPGPTFDVRPMNPGGPALRSHLPLRAADGRTLGVLALAHDAPQDAAARDRAVALAAEAARALAGSGSPT